MEIGRFYLRRVFHEHANSTIAYHLRYTDTHLREDTMIGRWGGSQVHMFSTAADMISDDDNETSDSPASTTTKRLSL